MSLVGYYQNLIEDEAWSDAFWFFHARNPMPSLRAQFMRAYDVVVRRAAERIARSIEDMLRRWVSIARARIAYRPGGPGYLEARRDFMVRAGQSRGTRSFKPY